MIIVVDRLLVETLRLFNQKSIFIHNICECKCVFVSLFFAASRFVRRFVDAACWWLLMPEMDLR